MIELIVGGKDLSQVVKTCSWSGGTRQVARKVTFKILSRNSDKKLPKVNLSEGDSVLLKVDGESVFRGILFDIDKSASSNEMSYLAFDFLFYVNKSQISRVYDCTAEAVAMSVAKELDIKPGQFAKTGVKVYMPCFGKTGYEAIMMAYTAASKVTGKKYIPIMQNIDKLAVIEKGKSSGVVLDGSLNLTNSNYHVSLQNVVNRVKITDKTGKVISTVENSLSRKKYGTVQKIYKKEDDKNAKAAAKALLSGIERTASVEALSDVRAISGYSIIIKEPISGLLGKFYIESDTHTFENGKRKMQLSLAFSNVMDEVEMEKQEGKNG